MCMQTAISLKHVCGPVCVCVCVCVCVLAPPTSTSFTLWTEKVSCKSSITLSIQVLKYCREEGSSSTLMDRTQRNIPPAPTYCSLLGKFQTHVVESLLLSNGCLNAGLPVVSKSVELVKAVLDVLSACLHSINIVVIQISAGLWVTAGDTPCTSCHQL